MTLAQFEEKREQEYVLHSVNMLYPLNVEAFERISIGGKKVSSGKWQWIDSTTPINYEISWTEGEPNNAAGNEECLNLSKKNKENGKVEFGLNDDPCDSVWKQHDFLCEKVEKLSVS
jgi:hypothetical protein